MFPPKFENLVWPTILTRFTGCCVGLVITVRSIRDRKRAVDYISISNNAATSLALLSRLGDLLSLSGRKVS